MNISSMEVKYKNNEENWFHSGVEHRMFKQALRLFSEKRYIACATISSVLFEKIFATRLIRETSFPEDFKPTKKNIKEQVKFLTSREEEIIGGVDEKGLFFTEITEKLEEYNIITKKEKEDYDSFYKEYRIPILHGLDYRLHEKITGEKSSTLLDPDKKWEYIYKKLSEINLNKIFDIVSGGKFRKK